MDRPDREGPNGEESETTVNRGKAMHQMSAYAELALESRGEAPRVKCSGEAGRAGISTSAWAEVWTSTFRTAVYGPVRTVVWEGSSEDHSLPPIPIQLDIVVRNGTQVRLRLLETP